MISSDAASKMISPDVARNFVGNVISFGLFLSPLPMFWRIIKNKDLDEFKSDPYLATLLNCKLWVFYDILCVIFGSKMYASLIAGGIGCQVFKWIDDPLDARHKELVRDLRDAVWDRDEEIERLQVEIERLQEEKFLLAARKQSNPEPKKMRGFMVWVLSVAFVICCTWVMCTN
ncbi:hypothetical protein QYE76_072056 [Lolium multiflorum]|uniref:Uncharacterized protein n=1 Tax=Lolium multiflorum TaxID=4521 RepID=A0AAD8UUT2_LOLMU|nr:hypothetical protein QYE76_072056 [Lolium multiflorum]